MTTAGTRGEVGALSASAAGGDSVRMSRDDADVRAGILITAVLTLLVTDQAAQDAIGPALSLRTVDPDGLPLAEVEVRLLDLADASASGALGTSGADGMLVLARDTSFTDFATSARAPMLQFSRRGRATVLMPLSAVADDGPRLELGDVPMPPGVRLRGVVHDESGAPLAGVHILAVDAFRMRLTSQLGTDDTFSVEGSAGPACCVTSDASGRFDLPGAPAQGIRIQARKTGFASSVSSTFGMGDRIEITLRRTGIVHGVAVDPTGRPVSTDLEFVDRIGHREYLHSGADGRFELGMPARESFVVRSLTAATDPERHWPADDEWLPVSKQEVRVVVADAPPPPAPRLRPLVRAIDRVTGELLGDARIGVAWREYLARTDSLPFAARTWVEWMEPISGGIASLRAPKADEDQVGVVLVEAPGHAARTFPVKWEQRDAPIEIKLAKAGRIHGKVVDGKSGAAMGGVRVKLGIQHGEGSQLSSIGAVVDEDGNATLESTVSAADGSFAFEDLIPAFVEVWATTSGRPPSEAKLVTLRPGKLEATVELWVPTGFAIGGSIAIPGGDRHGTWIAVTPYDPFSRARSFLLQNAVHRGRASRVGGDGSFRIEGLSPGEWSLIAFTMTSWPGVPSDPIRLGSLRVLDADLDKAFVLPELARARVAGAVVIAGAEIPFHRVAVAAWPVRSDDSAGVPSVFCAPDPTGAYELRLTCGDWMVAVFDAITGVQLIEGKPLTIGSGAPQSLELPVSCGEVRVSLAIEDGIASYCRVLQCEFPTRLADEPSAFVDATSIIPGADMTSSTTARLFLPAIECRLSIATWRVDTSTGEGDVRYVVPEALPVEVTAKPGEAIEVELGR